MQGITEKLPFMEPTSLPRGGMVLLTSVGPVQFGAPPETIKDTMGSPDGVPNVFVLTQQFLNYERGISFAEAEFPIYFNFFFKQRRVRIVCTAGQARRVTGIMQESLFGPATFDITPELPGPPGECDWMPDLHAELAYFRRSPAHPDRQMVLSDLVEFVLLDAVTRSVDLGGGVTVRVEADGSFAVEDAQSGKQTTVPGDLTLAPHRADEGDRSGLFHPPTFGVTVLGAGHGFDPKGRTTGFILWLNGRGLLVDPPVDTTQWLLDHDVPARNVDGILLTHVHADHDGGALQMALQADRLRLYTTPTVFGSFLRKAEVITGLASDRFHRIIEFIPVPLRQPVCISGARFVFNYSLHSIPTVRFEVWLGGKSLVYSADTLNDPEAIRRMRDEGALSPGRAADLLDFPWDHDLIIHEAGVPPLHTSIDVLGGLSDDIKARLHVVHTTAGAIPDGSGLHLAPLGLDGTIRLDAAAHPHTEAIRWLIALRNVWHFGDMPVDKALQFLEMATLQRRAAGQRIIRTGDPGEHFFIILSGLCAVYQGEVTCKVMGMYEFFGESSLVLDTPRTADVSALTDVELIVLGKQDFLRFAREMGISGRMAQLFKSRDERTWQLLDSHPVLSTMDTAQRTQFQSIMHREEHAAGDVLTWQYNPVAQAFLVAEGELGVEVDGREALRCGPGEFVASVGAIGDGSHQPMSLRSKGPMLVYRLDPDGFRDFLHRYPGIFLRLLHHRDVFETR